MALPLQISVRVLQKQAQIPKKFIFRQNSSTTSGAIKTVPNSAKQHNNNSLISPVFHNRNPRNLEMMTIASKPEGYHLEKFDVRYWHKLVVTGGQHRVLAEVIHNNGSTVVIASSTEFPVRKFLYRPSDVAAYKTVGKVIARRCLESGINSVYCEIEAEEGSKLASLMEEVEKTGLALKEPPNYVPPMKQSKGNPTKPWDIVL